MSGQHTQGRIKAKVTDLVQEDGRLRMASRITCCGAGGNMQQDVDAAIANARRLAACWNACIGLPTDDLEALPVPFAELAVGELLSTRKELAAARSLLREVVVDAQCANYIEERIRSYLDACDTVGGSHV